jgi:Flp pilus assembly protein TadD
LNTACINWPATSPADSHPGIRVDDQFATPSGADFNTWAIPPHSVSPPDLAAELAELRVHAADDLAAELRLFAPNADAADPANGDSLRALATMLARAMTVQAVASHIGQTAQWDVLCVNVEFVHAIKLHFLRAAADGVFGQVVTQAHVLQDMMLGHLMALAGEDATIVVVSANGLSFLPDGAVQVHSRGILAMSGPGITPDATLAGARLVDVAPTVLARYGIAIASDGKALVPPGQILRPVAMEKPELDDWDPALDLLADGYHDTLSPAQIAAMQDAEHIGLLNLGIALLARNDLASAAHVLELARASRPMDMHVLRRLASCHALMGDYPACRDLGQAMMQLDSLEPWGHLLLATWYALAGDPHDAEPYLVRARQLAASKPDALVRIGGLELARNNLLAAVGDFEAALALNPYSAEAAYGIGFARHALGDVGAAEAALRLAIRLEHHQPLAHGQLGLLLNAVGRWAEAVPTLETALAQGCDTPELRVALDRARAALGDILSAAVMRG